MPGICAPARFAPVLKFNRMYLSKAGGRNGCFRLCAVSTRDQDLASQIAELQAAGCGNIFKEKASGAKTDRPELAKVIRRLEHGDVLVVTRLGPAAKMPFGIHPHMLRHSTGFKLANQGVDTRSLQHYLGHKNIQHTVRYSELSPERFRDFWKD